MTNALATGMGSGVANGSAISSTTTSSVVFAFRVRASGLLVPRPSSLAFSMSSLTSLARFACNSRSSASTLAAYSSLSLIAFSVEDIPARSASRSRRLHSSSRSSCELSSLSNASLLAASVSTSRLARLSAASVSRSSSSVISL